MQKVEGMHRGLYFGEACLQHYAGSLVKEGEEMLTIYILYCNLKEDTQPKRNVMDDPKHDFDFQGKMKSIVEGVRRGLPVVGSEDSDLTPSDLLAKLRTEFFWRNAFYNFLYNADELKEAHQKYQAFRDSTLAQTVLRGDLYFLTRIDAGLIPVVANLKRQLKEGSVA